MRRISVSLLAGALAIAGLAALPGSALGNAKRADARLNHELATLVAMPQGPPGASVVIQREGKLRLHTAGTATVGANDPIRLNDRVRIASVTKAFTGAIVLRLVENHKLRLGSTIGQVRPDLPATWAPITVRQLLYHTSGLPDFSANPAFQQRVGMNPGGYISPPEIVGYAASLPLEFPAGAQYEYSNTDNIILALMAETATRTPYPTLLSRLVLRPLHLTQTSFPDQVTMPQPFAHGYFVDPGEPPEDVTELVSPSGAWAAGAIVSTPRDLNRFIRGWVNGLLTSKSVVKAQKKFLPPFTGGEPPGPGVNRGGLTLYRYKTACGVLQGHTGNTPGYTQLVAATPDGQRSLAVTVTEALNRPATGPQAVFAQLQQVFERAACSALAK